MNFLMLIKHCMQTSERQLSLSLRTFLKEKADIRQQCCEYLRLCFAPFRL